MFNQENYNRMARYAETQKKLAADPKQSHYWHEFRRGMCHTLPGFNREQIETSERVIDKNSADGAARGYWDGRDWGNHQIR